MRDSECPPSDHRRAAPRWGRWVPMLALALGAALAPLAGFGATAATGVDDEVLIDGAEVYSAVCSACHQPGGVGVSGSFPPLKDNPHVEDATYVEDVIRNGRTGEIIVGDTTYDGVMPAQSTLSDDDIVAVIAYIQSGFAAPAGPVAEVSTGPVAGTELPLLANYAWIAGALIALGGVALVLGPRLVGVADRRTMPWIDAWMKTAVIVVGAIVITTVAPAKVLEFETVQELPREAQDLIAVGIWSAGIAITLLALWYAHREKRI